MLYKPEKVICSVHDEKGRTTVIDLIDTKEKVFPVGRLDYDTSGLLLITNDGELTNYLTHPKGNVTKTYLAKVDGFVISIFFFNAIAFNNTVSPEAIPGLSIGIIIHMQ